MKYLKVFLVRFFFCIILIIFSPIFLFISLVCLIFQGFPIIYRSKRIGKNGGSFMIYKFRTMVDNHSINDFSSFNDHRVTKWGRVLRYYKIDEMPQLINIIFGDMVFACLLFFIRNNY